MHHPIDTCPMCDEPRTLLDMQYIGDMCERCAVAWAAARAKLNQSIVARGWAIGHGTGARST